jgi:macrolide-specific efflux system membrane fusion protein
LGNSTRRKPGKLRQILPTPTVVNNVVLYTALFDVANPDKNLMSQMTAQVFFVLGAAHNVVIAPVAALKYADTAKPRVAGRQPGGRNLGAPRRRPATVTVVLPSGAHEDRAVMVGITNRVDAEIVSGLAPGEKVIAGILAAATVKTARPATAGGTAGAGGFGRGGP